MSIGSGPPKHTVINNNKVEIDNTYFDVVGGRDALIEHADARGDKQRHRDEVIT